VDTKLKPMRFWLSTPSAEIATGLWRVRFSTDWTEYSPDFGNQPSFDTEARPGERDGMPFSAPAGLGGAYSAVILSQ